MISLLRTSSFIKSTKIKRKPLTRSLSQWLPHDTGIVNTSKIINLKVFGPVITNNFSIHFQTEGSRAEDTHLFSVKFSEKHQLLDYLKKYKIINEDQEVDHILTKYK